MNRRIVVLGAPSSIGIRPYDDGTVRRLDLAPGVLREGGLVRRLGARDAGDVVPGPYRDYDRPPGGIRNEEELTAYSRDLAGAVAGAATDDAFLLLLGGDCSVVLGIHQSGRGAPGLAYIDAHSDFATPQQSQTGSAASMDLALAAGRGDSPLARLGDNGPLIRERDIVVIGRRDHAEWSADWGKDELAASAALDLPRDEVRARGPAAIADAALERLAEPAAGFWIHVDADVIDPSIMPAVDSPEPDGLGLEELAALLAPLVAHRRALGLNLTIYDPALDPDRACAQRLVALLERVLAGEERAPPAR